MSSVCEASLGAVTPQAGWYPDPTGRQRSRYWDGRHWSSWVNEFHAQDPLPPGRDVRSPEPGIPPAHVDQPIASPTPEGNEDAGRTAAPGGTSPRWRDDPTKEQERARVWMGCGLAALWVIGGFAIVFVAAAIGVANDWSCGESGLNCDSNEPQITLGLGFAMLTVITIIWVGYGRWRSGDRYRPDGEPRHSEDEPTELRSSLDALAHRPGDVTANRGTEPGWFPDPARRAWQRWWDGEAWTATVIRAGDLPGTWSNDPLGSPSRPAPHPE